jgi:hypothetical protein
VKLRFDGKFARFQNYTERDAPPASAGFDPEPGWGEDPEEPPF